MNASYGGLAGKILWVDLTQKKIWTEKTSKYTSRFLGGRAINSFILLKETSSKTKYYDPENLLIIGAGRLVGTPMLGACRVSVDTVNAFSNGKGSANVGGFWGAELKYAGYDNIVIKGVSETPVFLLITNDTVEIKNADMIWGKTTSQSEGIIKSTLGDDRIKIISIGPAGENMVRGACLITSPGKSASGSGVGCVMGSKKLKAIAVRGRGSISVAEPVKFINKVDEVFEKVKASPYLEGWRKGIIEGKYLPDSPAWNYLASYRNGQDDYVSIEDREKLVGLGSGVPKYKKRMFSCFSCPAGCMPIYEINRGKYQGTKSYGYWINSTTYSSKLGLFDPEASIRFHYMCNEMGVDGDMCANTMAWAFECYEKGLITKEDTGGLELEWGNADSILAMQERLVYRKGFGDLLAEGVKEASRKLGKGSESLAVHMKGQDTVDPYRIIKGWGFGLSISPIAGKHLRGAVSTPEVTGPNDVEWSSTDYKNVPEVVYWQSIVKELEDAIGNCIYVGTWSGVHALSVLDYAELLSAASGTEITPSALMDYGRRSLNLEKAFNTIHARFDRKDDYPPTRYMEEPVKSGPFKGHKCDKEMWNKMLDKYYELNDWDIKSGLQTRSCLERIGLNDIVEMLENEGLLIQR